VHACSSALKYGQHFSKTVNSETKLVFTKNELLTSGIICAFYDNSILQDAAIMFTSSKPKFTVLLN